MIKLVLEANDLIFQLNNFTLAIDELAFLTLQITSFGIDKLIEIINSGELLRDIVLKSSSLSSKVRAFLALHLILVVEFVDLLRVLLISLSKTE